MALTELKESIEGASHTDLRRIRKEAEDEAERILGEAKAEVDAIIKNAKDAAAKESELLRLRLDAELELESRNMLLEAQAYAVEHELRRIRPVVEHELAKHASDIAGAAIKQFRGIAGDDILADSGKGPLPLRDPKRQFGSGVVLYSKDRRIRLDASMKGILDDSRDLMLGIVSKGLFG